MGTRIALMAYAFVGCVSSAPSPDATRHHDNGIAYLGLATGSSSDVEMRRLCDQAEQSCRLALEFSPRFAHAYNCLGLIEMSCHRRYEAAAEHFKKAISNFDDFAEAHNNLGVTFQRRTPPDHERASEEFLAALEIAPGYVDARRNLGLALIHLHRWEEARAHLLRLLEIEKPNATTHHHLGLIGLSTERYDDAEYHLKRCLELEKDHPICSYELGNTYLATERLDDAILAYATALRQPSEIEIAARQNLRIAYQRAAHQDGAIQKLIDHCRSQPGNADCHFDLGTIYADRGHFAEAVAEWRIATQLAPDYCRAHHRIAVEAMRVLDTAESERACQETIACVDRVGGERLLGLKAECVSFMRDVALR